MESFLEEVMCKLRPGEGGALGGGDRGAPSGGTRHLPSPTVRDNVGFYKNRMEFSLAKKVNRSPRSPWHSEDVRDPQHPFCTPH